MPRSEDSEFIPLHLRPNKEIQIIKWEYESHSVFLIKDAVRTE